MGNGDNPVHWFLHSKVHASTKRWGELLLHLEIRNGAMAMKKK
jgi:hypothetical protein